jgi:hypothetical protein
MGHSLNLHNVGTYIAVSHLNETDRRQILVKSEPLFDHSSTARFLLAKPPRMSSIVAGKVMA